MSAAEKKSTGIVGFFVFFGLVITGILIVQFGRFSERFRDNYKITAEFHDAKGLVAHSPVNMRGARVGKVVSKPKLNDFGMIEVELRIDSRIKIPKGSQFQISSAGIMGDMVITIKPSEDDSAGYIENGARIQGKGGGGLDALQNDAAEIASDARIMMKNASVAMEKASTTMSKIDGTLDEDLNTTVTTINKNVLNTKNTTHIASILKNIDDTSAEIKKSGAALQPILAEVKSTLQTINTATGSANKTFVKASEQIEKIEPALSNLPETLASFKQAAEKASKLMDNVGGVVNETKKTVTTINNSKGLLSTLTQDEEVTDDTKNFVKNLREHGILGYRDESKPEESPRDRYRGSRR